MSDHVTIHLISDAFRRDHHVPASETFMVVHHQGQAAEVLGTDEDLPRCLTPDAWARDAAVHRGVPYVDPVDIGFALSHATARWYGYDLADDDDSWVPNPYADLPPIVVRTPVGAR